MKCHQIWLENLGIPWKSSTHLNVATPERKNLDLKTKDVDCFCNCLRMWAAPVSPRAQKPADFCNSNSNSASLSSRMPQALAAYIVSSHEWSSTRHSLDRESKCSTKTRQAKQVQYLQCSSKHALTTPASLLNTQTISNNPKHLKVSPLPAQSAVAARVAPSTPAQCQGPSICPHQTCYKMKI